MEPYSVRRYPHANLVQGQYETMPDPTPASLALAARGLARTKMVGRGPGGIISEEGLKVEARMNENAERHARERSSAVGLEMPIIFND